MKKLYGKTNWIAVLLSTAMIATAAPAFAATDRLEVTVDGVTLDYGTLAPVIRNDTMLVPQEPTYAALGVPSVDSAHASVTDVNGTSYVPLRKVGEAAGYEVRWDDASRSAMLFAKGAETGSRGFLWEVSDEDNTVYLVGSMHIADDSFYPLDASFEEAFADAEYLGVEVDVSRAADPDVQELIMSLGTYQDGATLKDHVSEEVYAKLGDFLARNGLESDAFDAFKPWVVEMTVASLKAAQAGYEAQVGIDLYFVQKAVERNIPVIELESYESQLQMFDGFSEALQSKNLEAALDNHDVLDDAVDEMAKMWKNGDEDGLLEFTKEMSKDEEYRKAMLTDRNAAMADKIEGYLEDEEDADYFIVIGAAHYLGEDGILELLEEKGFTVTRE